MRIRDPVFLAWVHTLPCCARELSECEGGLEADHAGRRPYGRKCNDNETIPLCTKHHRERGDFSGVFKTWVQAQMRAWLLEQIANTQAAYERHLAGYDPVW